MPELFAAVAYPVPPAATVGFLGFDATTWGVIAILGWLLVLGVGALAGLRLLWPVRRPRPGRPAGDTAGSAEAFEFDPPDMLRVVAPGEDPASGVLGWTMSATDADAVAFLELSPGGGERLRIAPRGLGSETITELARVARRGLVDADLIEGEIEGARLIRWAGAGGSKVLIASGAGEPAEEPLRFARYLLEWLGAARRQRPRADVEDRLRWIKGLAWAEVDEQRARLLLAERADLTAVKREVERVLDATDIRAEWVAEGPPPPSEGLAVFDRDLLRAVREEGEPEAEGAAPLPEREPAVASVGTGRGVRLSDEELAGVPGRGEARIRLADVVLSENGKSTADVRITWKDQEIRGRGHGAATPSGRVFAAAQAVADAIRPLLRNDVAVERLYSASMKEGGSVLIAEVLMEGARYVGAVVEQPDQRDWTGARAVLDAVNRRLTQLAGRSGRV